MRIQNLHPKALYRRFKGHRQGASGVISKELKYKGQVAEEYLKKRAHRRDWHEEQLVLGHFMSKLSDGISVADIPFGTGRFLPLYLAKKCRVLGVDVSETMLEVSKEFNCLRFVKFETCEGDATELKMDDESVDLVVSYRFLGYILTVARAQQAIREFARISRSHLIIELQYLKDGAPEGSLDKLGHKLTWSKQQRFLEEIGLNVVEKFDLMGKEEYCNTIVLANKVGAK